MRQREQRERGVGVRIAGVIVGAGAWGAAPAHTERTCCCCSGAWRGLRRRCQLWRPGGEAASQLAPQGAIFRAGRRGSAGHVADALEVGGQLAARRAQRRILHLQGQEPRSEGRGHCEAAERQQRQPQRAKRAFSSACILAGASAPHTQIWLCIATAGTWPVPQRRRRRPRPRAAACPTHPARLHERPPVGLAPLGDGQAQPAQAQGCGARQRAQGQCNGYSEARDVRRHSAGDATRG